MASIDLPELVWVKILEETASVKTWGRLERLSRPLQRLIRRDVWPSASKLRIRRTTAGFLLSIGGPDQEELFLSSTAFLQALSVIVSRCKKINSIYLWWQRYCADCQGPWTRTVQLLAQNKIFQAVKSLTLQFDVNSCDSGKHYDPDLVFLYQSLILRFSASLLSLHVENLPLKCYSVGLLELSEAVHSCTKLQRLFIRSEESEYVDKDAIYVNLLSEKPDLKEVTLFSLGTFSPIHVITGLFHCSSKLDKFWFSIYKRLASFGRNADFMKKLPEQLAEKLRRGASNPLSEARTILGQFPNDFACPKAQVFSIILHKFDDASFQINICLHTTDFLANFAYSDSLRFFLILEDDPVVSKMSEANNAKEFVLRLEADRRSQNPPNIQAILDSSIWTRHSSTEGLPSVVQEMFVDLRVNESNFISIQKGSAVVCVASLDIPMRSVYKMVYGCAQVGCRHRMGPEWTRKLAPIIDPNYHLKHGQK